MSGLRDTIQRLISESQPIYEHPTDAIMAVIEAALGEQRDELAAVLDAEAKWLREAYESTEEKRPQERRDYMMRMLATEDAANTVRFHGTLGRAG